MTSAERTFYYDLVRLMSALPAQILFVGFNKLDSEEFWNVESKAEFEKVKARKLADINHWISDLTILKMFVAACEYEDRCRMEDAE